MSNNKHSGFPLCRGDLDLTLQIERLEKMNKIYDQHIKKLNKKIEDLEYRLKNLKDIEEKHQEQIGKLIEENKTLKEGK